MSASAPVKAKNLDKIQQARRVEFMAACRRFELKPGWREHHGPGQWHDHEALVVDFINCRATLDPSDPADMQKIELLRQRIADGEQSARSVRLTENGAGDAINEPAPGWSYLNPQAKLELAKAAQWTPELLEQAILYERQHAGDASTVKALDAMLDPVVPRTDSSGDIEKPTGF